MKMKLQNNAMKFEMKDKNANAFVADHKEMSTARHATP